MFLIRAITRWWQYRQWFRSLSTQEQAQERKRQEWMRRGGTGRA